jgi:hypothetical protein
MTFLISVDIVSPPVKDARAGGSGPRDGRLAEFGLF